MSRAKDSKSEKAETRLDSALNLLNKILKIEADAEKAVEDPKPKVKPRVTNIDYQKHNPVFVRACTIAGVNPSRRQASKYRNGRGISYRKKDEALNQLKREGVL
jgi:hypothetical protein